MDKLYSENGQNITIKVANKYLISSPTHKKERGLKKWLKTH
jgi:hypothetical protein